MVGGSKTYVERAAKDLTAVHTSTPVRSVHRRADGIAIHDDADIVHLVDHAVLAGHPDQALSILAEPTRDESRLLGAFEFLPSTAMLHTDTSVLPARPTGPGILELPDDELPGRTRAGPDQLRHQPPATDRDERGYVVTLNDDPGENGAVDPRSVLARMTYAHPCYTRASVAAQRELHLINTDRLAFAGAWQGWGFHEDGCVSGVRAATSLGAGW